MTDLAELANHVERLAEARVLCVGDLMLDRFVHGEVERISPEAPIPVMRVGHETAMLGGAGNVVRNLVSLGASCTFVSVIGGDAAGHELATMIGEEPRVEPYLLTDPARVSTIKTRFLAAGQQLLRTDWEGAGAVSAAITDDLVRAAAGAVEGCEVVVLSDYGKGVVCGAVIDAVIERARVLETPVVVDPKGDDFARYRGATVITPNRQELAAATGLATDGDEAVVRAARRVIERCGIGTVLVTRSHEGMSLVGEEGVAHLAAHAREVFDVSGAGDTVVAVFAAAHAAGLEMVDSARLANAAAGIVVTKVGTAAVFGSDLIRALHRSDVLSRDAKVMAAGPAADRIARWRRQGLAIGFTNGCFDLLHPGHVSLLRQARAACDRLLVGLNSDASAARIKGPGRPVQGEAARALLLASLEDVDLVVVFAEDTPLALIERFRPDVLVKGADYALSEVVGAELVHGYGGRVLLAEIEPGHSTSGTIARVARRA
jgi:D-beta-D-heptose 7-phosphate kinase/D-beta-D-heptose 1-phosphate adenosyltransferase